MSEHTKGPWAWVEKDGNAFLMPVNHEDAALYPGLCAILDDGSAYGEYSRSIEPDSADAILIAAAPDLLEALESVLECWISHIRGGDHGGTDDEDDALTWPEVANAKATIAKAKGLPQ